eukprot:9558982-Prorocentrum_lima.AAC.1
MQRWANASALGQQTGKHKLLRRQQECKLQIGSGRPVDADSGFDGTETVRRIHEIGAEPPCSPGSKDGP